MVLEEKIEELKQGTYSIGFYFKTFCQPAQKLSSGRGQGDQRNMLNRIRK